jgi:hypothetical protein
MAFRLKLNPSYEAVNRNPNMRPQPREAVKPQRDWIAIGLMVAIGVLIGCGLALAALEWTT